MPRAIDRPTTRAENHKNDLSLCYVSIVTFVIASHVFTIGR
jgi:hypothetical protein